MRNSGLRYPRLGWVVLLTIVCFAIAPGAQAWSLYVSNQVSGIVAAYDSTSGAFQADVGRYSLPAGLTINGNDLYVSDLLANTIYSVPLSGGSQSTFITLPGNSGPFQVAFDALGNAYVATLVSGLVYKFDSSGTEIGSPVAVSRARGITYDPVDGNLYVVSTPNSDGFGGIDAIEQLSTSLMVLNPAFITSNMRQGGATAEPAINAPRFIAIDSVGNFAISNTGTDPTVFDAGFVADFNSAGFWVGNLARAQGPNEIAGSGRFVPGAYVIYFTEYFGDNVETCGPGPCGFLINQGTGDGTLGLALGPTFGTPEPATVGLIGAGLVAFALIRRRVRK